MLNLFKKKPTPDYQAELEWKYPERPVVMSWTRWAIPRSNLQTSILFIALLMPPLITAAVCYAGLTKGHAPGFYWKEFLLSLIAIVILFPIMCGMIFEHRFYVYRVTEQGLEVYSWQESYKKAILLLKIILILTGIALVIVAVHMGSVTIFFGALVGPMGIGLLGLTSMTSENFEKVNRSFQHSECTWSEIETAILIDNRRKIIGIKGSSYFEQGNFTVTSIYSIFCDKEHFEPVLSFIKAKHPSVPCEAASAKIDYAVTYEGKPKDGVPYSYVTKPIPSHDNKTSL